MKASTDVMPQAARSKRESSAIVTPSYAADLERCRLLCESIDRFVTGFEEHYLLVADHDVALFRELESRNRIVIAERDLLPPWLHSMRDPTSLFRRHIWLSTHTAPLRGWHVQQLRRIAIAEKISEAALVYCDSDVVFLKPFDVASFWRGGRLRLYRCDGALPLGEGKDHDAWVKNAAEVLGLPPEARNDHDYISTVIAWRRETVVSMIRHIETLHGRHWVEAIAARRRFSECILYGRYVDEVLDGRGHFHDPTQFCRVYWDGPRLSEESLREFVASMTPEQVAIGIQSFTGTDLGTMRNLLALARS